MPLASQDLRELFPTSEQLAQGCYAPQRLGCDKRTMTWRCSTSLWNLSCACMLLQQKGLRAKVIGPGSHVDKYGNLLTKTLPSVQGIVPSRNPEPNRKLSAVAKASCPVLGNQGLGGGCCEHLVHSFFPAVSAYVPKL